MRPTEVSGILSQPASQEMLKRGLARLAFVARDGTPRAIPIGFTWNGAEIVMCTSKNARKLDALRDNPAVALTIDTDVHPPKILLVRGTVDLDFVDGIPDEYVEANTSDGYTMTPEQREVWESEVRATYVDGMVRIVMTPNWAKYIDFETTLPTAIDELMRQREARENAGTSSADDK